MELVYPFDIAPLERGSKSQGGEILPVVEPNGVVIGRASRALCHGGSMLLHPVVHLHLIDRYSKVYLQLRSVVKRTYPLHWDIAVAGHVSYGESLSEALYREASEELGLTDFNPVELQTYIYETSSRRELVTVYAAIGHFELRPDMEEVADGRWWDIDEIERAYGTDTLTPTFEKEFKAIKDSLLALL